MVSVERFVREHEGCVDPRIFSDEEIYREEMERIFRRTWLYVGHESQIPQPGDYLLNYMGEDEVILVRDIRGKVRVFLNWCPHRGNRVCVFDRGNRKVFTCLFHGWAFDTEGRLVGQAYKDQAYEEDKSSGWFREQEWGLIEVPRVESYHGLIFASWNEEICSLQDYLGDFRYYLDLLITRPHLGGIEVIPGRGRYVQNLNWKVIAENFMFDDYHVPTTHASIFKALAETSFNWWSGLAKWEETTYQILSVSPAGAPHCIGAVALWGDPRPFSAFHLQREWDRAFARELGREAEEWVEERYRRMDEYIKRGNPKVLGVANGTIFPNLSLLVGLSAFRGTSLIQWHPKGPTAHEAWQWCAVEREAPESVKRIAAILQASDQAPAGMITIDDQANFDRMKDNLKAARYQRKPRPFSYHMSGRPKAVEAELRSLGFLPEEFPGRILPLLSEEPARQFYRYYRELMMA